MFRARQLTRALWHATPSRLRSVLRALRGFFLEYAYKGHNRECPICAGTFSAFRSYGRPRRSDALCPKCGSLERHRFAWLYLVRQLDVLRSPPQRLLHVAPERCLQDLLKAAIGKGYLAVDLQRSNVTASMDVTSLALRSASIDAVYCSHVLEHVPDDRRAISEFFRVLKPGGWAAIMVPVKGERTLDASDLRDPLQREKLFGQHDHVRQYGRDIVMRLAMPGFQVSTIEPADICSPSEITRWGLTEASGAIYFCVKP
ncbi:MAG: type 11 methyltransferase [Nitrospiraceae bacterium]|nr:MAG: type 11 methyltransferase [Nitrospiraceae bacterium]